MATNGTASSSQFSSSSTILLWLDGKGSLVTVLPLVTVLGRLISSRFLASPNIDYSANQKLAFAELVLARLRPTSEYSLDVASRVKACRV